MPRIPRQPREVVSRLLLWNRFGNQIIVRMADNLNPGKIGYWEASPDVNPPINIWSVALAPGHQKASPPGTGALILTNQAMFPRIDSSGPQISSRGFPLHQDSHFAANLGL